MSEVKEKYGLLFPADMPDAMIDLKIWKHWREPEYAGCTEKAPWDCFWRAIYTLLPREAFVRQTFSEQHVFDWTTEGFIITWGCAASSKSNDYGLLTLADWVVDPDKTVAIMASTSLAMLKIRSYESVLRYFYLLQKHAPWQMPGKLRKTDSAIILDSDDDMGAATDKASIRGVAVAEGTDQEARTKLTGAHLPYVRLILDELSQMRPAAMQVRTNLSIGAKDFKLVGLCNPDSFVDLAALHSIPLLPGGFAALDPETSGEWRSQYGKIRRHDGLKSPAVLEPDGEKKYPFLLTRPRLNQILEEHSNNPDDPEVWTMVRGFPPSQGKRQTLITMSEILRAGATDDVSWYGSEAVTILGVDPAFTEGGNRAVMQAMDVGFDKDMLLKLAFHAPRYIRLDASSQTPILAQVGEAIWKLSDDLKIPEVLIGVDDSATQSVADHLLSTYRLRVHRFISNKKASDLPMSIKNREPAKDRYFDQSTELWAATAAFIRAGQVRGLPLAAGDQLATRTMEPGRRPHKLMSKKRSKHDGNQMVSDSPDDMDAVSFCVGIARFVLHLLAGSETMPDKYGDKDTIAGFRRLGGLRQLAVKHDLDSRAYEPDTAAV